MYQVFSVESSFKCNGLYLLVDIVPRTTVSGKCFGNFVAMCVNDVKIVVDHEQPCFGGKPHWLDRARL